MINGGTTIHTPHGYSITVRRVGLEIDLEIRDARGDAISTVRMSEAAARRLLDELDGETKGSSDYNSTYRDGYESGYRHGHSDGRDEAL